MFLSNYKEEYYKNNHDPAPFKKPGKSSVSRQVGCSGALPPQGRKEKYMTGNNPVKIQQPDPLSPKARKRARRRDRAADIPATNRIFSHITGMLPAGMTPRSKRIVVVSGIIILAGIALFIIGGFIAGMTGLYDQVLTIVAAEFIIVGAVTAAAIIYVKITRGK